MRSVKTVGVVLVVAALALFEPVSGAEESGASGPATMDLTLAQAVQLALRDNPDLVAVRLNRALQQYDLNEAEERFVPRLNSGALRIEYRTDQKTNVASYRIEAGPYLSMRLPTGGSIRAGPSWSAAITRENRQIHDDSAGLGFSLSQPLLKGGGLEIGMAPVRLARIAEDRNILHFKAAIMDIVTETIRAYRAVTQAELRVDIDRRSLQRAKETLAVNRVLIETGRMAERDITQTEADIARRELSLVKSQDSLNDVRRDLNVLLDLGSTVRVVPIEPITFEAAKAGLLNAQRSKALARLHHTSYLDALLNVRRAEIDLVLADNSALWDLSFTASAQYEGAGKSFGSGLGDLTGNTDEGRYALGLALTIPFSDDTARASDRSRLAARIALRRAESALASTTREMDTNVHNAVRTVRTSLREAELAREALALAEKKLGIERDKLKLGLSSNYRLAEFQTDLVDAQVSEVNARIGYLNALSALDRILGTVLDTWQIDIERVQESLP